MQEMSLKTQALVLVSLSVMLLSSTTLITFGMIQNNAREVTEDAMKFKADSLCREISGWIEDITASLQYIAYSNEMASCTTPNGYIRFQDKEYLTKLLNLVLLSNSEVTELRITMHSGQSFALSKENGSAYTRLQDYLFYIDTLQDGIVSQALQTGQIIISEVYRVPNRESAKHMLYIAVPMQAEIYEPCYGVLTAACNLDRFLSASFPEKTKYAVYRQDELQISTDPEFFVTYTGTGIPHGNYQIASSSQAGGWSILLAYEVSTDGREPLVMSSVFLINVLVSHLVLLLLINRLIVRPIQSLSSQVSHIQSGNEKLDFDANGDNEIEYLTLNLNDMLKRLQQDRNARIEAQQLMHAAQIRSMSERIMMLQAQVNPHFLYNTLECIRGMAAYGDMEAVREMVSTMAQIYRYCLKHDVCATLAEELTCAEAFFRIIHLRYANKFQLSIDVPETLMSQIIPCMTLQPLLENSIYHGFAGREQGHIWIYAQEDYLVVEDDGNSLSERQLNEINAQLQEAEEVQNENTRVGLQNVNMRLKLLTHRKRCLFLCQVPGSGLAVHIHLDKNSNN